ncbi:hypothetical protein [Ancylomarina longa]|uniref:Lipoprotein n=1 Tax=Ancylomarina longa TaxID=2487017 RepID=A0A434AVJ7_9BACT|nr:hypothetical protein [Ancylomarina longa]RUT78515.1 hypothetical protein DLK05_08045 [Ancylomarina longa]
MKIYLVVFLFLFSGLLFSSCDGNAPIDFPTEVIQLSGVSDSVFQILLDDSKLICLDQYLIEEMKEINSIDIEETHIAPIVAALQMVYLDSTIVAANTIKELHIHALCRQQLHQTMVKEDTLQPFFSNWFANGISGNSQLDELIAFYNLDIDSLGNAQYLISTDVGLNHQALAAKIRDFPFVKSANAQACIGDGSQIELIDSSPDQINLVFSYGWGDCPSGCIHRHYWDLSVSGSGIVELIRESGDKLP